MDKEENPTTAELKKLSQEVLRLTHENERLRLQVTRPRFLLRLNRRILDIIAKIALGAPLDEAMRKWANSFSESRTLPRDETIELAGAVIRRVTRITILGILAVVTPGILMIWQNCLIREQSRDQVLANYFGRKGELIQLLYGRSCGGQEVSKTYESARYRYLCVPNSGWRLRSEAARVYLDSERLYGAKPDLTGAQLSETWIIEGDFSGAKLFFTDFRAANVGSAKFVDANLSEAIFVGANLAKSDFRGSILSKTIFAEANLVGANFQNVEIATTDFRGANLNGASFSGSSLIMCDLRGADLSNADLNDVSFSAIVYSNSTKWPSHFDPEKINGQKCDNDKIYNGVDFIPSMDSPCRMRPSGADVEDEGATTALDIR